MKVIFVVSALHGGGAERVIVTLANTFSKRGDEVIILMTAGAERAYETEAAVELVSIGDASHGNKLAQLKRILAMRRFFNVHSDYRIVSFSTTINMFTILSTLGLSNQVVVSERNDPNQCHYKKLRNFVYRFGQKFVFQTEDAKNCFPAKIRKNSVVIPNPIRKDLPAVIPFYQDGNIWVREKKIAAVGRLEPQKNHALLLKAFAEFHKKFPDWELHIFGRGSLESLLKQQAKELRIGEKVIFEGFRKDILEMIRSYGMYVLSSDYEGISNSLMEAMAMGMPCISTDCPIGGSTLCIQNGMNGLLVPVGSVQALQRAMESIAGNEKLAEQFGKKSIAVRDVFSEDVIVDKWHRYIKQAYKTI